MRSNIHCAKCGNFLELNRMFVQSYCKSCHAEHMRENRRKHSELHPKAKQKANARAYANAYQTRGLIEKQPCSACGSHDQVEKHHHDYSKPLEVTWLCRVCHMKLHAEAEAV